MKKQEFKHPMFSLEGMIERGCFENSGPTSRDWYNSCFVIFSIICAIIIRHTT